MAQPMSAAPEDTPSIEKPSGTPPAPDSIIYPKNSPDRPAGVAVEKGSDTSRMLIMLIALGLAAAGVWVFVQKRQSGPLAARGQRKLQIDETRPLGNRQYLIVANYDGKKFLLGVTPGRINLLTPLDSVDTSPRPSDSTEKQS
jgi:flagellar protein FliO/FliZ